jgi:copper(I)-binding protein
VTPPRPLAAVASILAACALVVNGPVRAAGQDTRIIVQDAWARAMPPVATSSELYLVILNQGAAADRLVAAQSEACARLEPYETYTLGQGMMGMRPIPAGAVEVPPGRLELKPGGLHLMCMEKRQDLRAGMRVPLRLRFRDAGDVLVEVDIRAR